MMTNLVFFFVPTGASSGVTSIGGLSASVILGVTLGAVVLIFRSV